jgi:hypothetical protein
MIFNTTNHYNLYYPEKRSIATITENIIGNIKNDKGNIVECQLY